MLKIKQRIQRIDRFPRDKQSRLEFVRLDKNENLLSWKKPLLFKIMKSLKPKELSAYPEPAKLYKKLAAYLGVEEENLLLTNGSDGGIKSAFEIFVEPGDEVMVLDPTYAMYDMYIQMFGAKKIGISFNRDFNLDQNSLLKAISPKVKLIAIANPNSPTGTVLDQDFLLEVVKRANSSGSAVLIDEAYFHFYSQTMLQFVKQFDNLLILRTFSKALGAAAVRLGYVVSQSYIIDALFKVRPMYEAHTFALKVAEFILDHPEHIENYIRLEREGKDYLTAGLSQLGLEVFRGHANFVLVKAKGRREEIAACLRAQGVLIYLPSKGSFLEDYFRVTTGPKEKMAILLKHLGDYLKK